MNDRIKLRVMGLSYSQIQNGAYALILAQVDGPFRIPVVIGPAEAQAIAMRMESVTPPRPMTHDLFVSFAHAFGVRLESVFIYKFEEGIFYSELTFTDGERSIKIDSRTSDAIAIAMRTGSPIYTTSAIIDEAGFIMEVEEAEDETGGEEVEANEMFMEASEEPLPYGNAPRPENFTIEELEKTMHRLIDEENYEEAAKISKIINEKKNKNNQ